MSKPKTVLVVDDTNDIANLFAAIIQTLGCIVLTAYNGGEAVRKATAYRPDLIFMDLRMPVMDGYEATRRILSLPGLSATPLVAVSGHYELDVQERARAAGCIEYLSKPVEPEAFEEMVRKYVGRSA